MTLVYLFLYDGDYRKTIRRAYVVMKFRICHVLETDVRRNLLRRIFDEHRPYHIFRNFFYLCVKNKDNHQLLNLTFP